MAKQVYPIPMTPRSEKGARDAKFFSRQSGKRQKDVSPRSVLVRLRFMPAVVNNALPVSASTIL